MNHKGFTLAEVLITLGIIGIVASMTIPTLINNSNDQSYKVAAKKAYSQFQQIYSQIRSENGENELVPENGSYKNSFMPYFKVIKDCDQHDCVPMSASSPIYKTLDGSNAVTVHMGSGQFVTADGMFYAFAATYVTVDVNGYMKGPNTFGKDTFRFEVWPEGKIVPTGQQYTSYSVDDGFCDRKTPIGGLQGLGCMYYVIKGVDY
jgi:prepilin-type N-terminal cleavage/methylation domain-containing protein